MLLRLYWRIPYWMSVRHSLILSCVISMASYAFSSADEVTMKGDTWNSVNQAPWMWRHNGRDCVSNHQPYDCLLNLLFKQIKESIKAPRHWHLCREFTGGRSFPAHKWPVTRNMFTFDDVIMQNTKKREPYAWFMGSNLVDNRIPHNDYKNEERLPVFHNIYFTIHKPGIA